jgi:membrane protease YdiL (CAAX protease family)
MTNDIEEVPRNSVRQRELFGYFGCALGFTWLIHFSISFFGIPFTMDISNPGMHLYLVGLAGPLVAAVTITAVKTGKAGVRSFFAQGLKWRFPIRWYVFAIFTIPMLSLLNILIFNDRIPEDFSWLVVEPLLIGGQLWVVLAEEFGWRGFALPRLQSLYGSLGATLVLGPLWAIWHLPMFFIEGSPQYSENVPAAFLLYMLIITCISILLTVVYNRTQGSVLACMLLHGFLNISAFTIRVPPESNITMYLIVGVALLSIALLDRPLFRRQ